MAEPIDMVLHCPKCGMQHIDEPESDAAYRDYLALGGIDNQWTNPPHRSHLCRKEDGGCGTIWRPADVPTNGVRKTKTRGTGDTWPAGVLASGTGHSEWHDLNSAADAVERVGKTGDWDEAYCAKLSKWLRQRAAHGVPVDAAPSGLVVGSTGADWQAVAEMVAIEDGLGTVFVEFTAPRPPAGTKLYVQANAGVPEVVADHTHSDYADGFDAGVEVGAQQFRDFLAHYAPVYVKDIRQWHRDFLAARNAGVAPTQGDQRG